MQNQNEYKIYSRARLRIGNRKKRGYKNRRYNVKLKKNLPVFIIAFIAFSTCYIVWKSLNPVFDALCDDEARAVATKITNEETSNVMNKYNYDSFFTIEKDDRGGVQMINANVLRINQVTSDIALNIQNALKQNEKDEIYISMGSLTSMRLLAGMGPKIPIKISCIGNVETDLRSEFISEGVNQTVHKVYLEVITTVNILTPVSTTEKSINNQVLIAENVIVGDIPATYYNFNGLNSKDDVMEMVE